jgi:hypothetical protein
LFGRYQLISHIQTNLSITDIPQTSKYTIIFHDGSIEPPVRLNLKVDSCEGEIIFISAEEEYGLISTAEDESEDFGFITQPFDSGEDYEEITNLISSITHNDSYNIVPTKCQIYEQDLGIQSFLDGGFDDYLFVNIEATRYQNFGLIDELTDNPQDYGYVLESMSGGFSQLRLGPVKRNFDRLKFNTQGGYSQIIGVGDQSGTTILNFQDHKISDYVFFGGRKHKKVTNATITQYITGDESNSLPPS